MVQKLFKREKSLNELEEETERLEVEERKATLEYSIAQKKAMANELNERGLKPSHFGDTKETDTWTKIRKWLATH